VQGNILAVNVVAAREHIRAHKGTLAERMYAALLAGDREGMTRGNIRCAPRCQKGALAYTDRAIDIRVDDHQSPSSSWPPLRWLSEYAWNEG
jgi:uncharacterized Ntn-hydrolase superfamily protein